MYPGPDRDMWAPLAGE